MSGERVGELVVLVATEEVGLSEIRAENEHERSVRK